MAGRGGKASMNVVLTRVFGQEKAGTSSRRSRRPPNRFPVEGGEGEPDVPRARARGRGRGRHTRPRTRPVLDVSATEQAAPKRRRVSSTPSASEIPSASGSTPSEDEQGDEYLDAEQGEEGEYEEGMRGQEDLEDEEGGWDEDAERGEEDHPEASQGKKRKIWNRGSARLPSPPTNENDKLEVCLATDEALALVPPKGRNPSGILTCILKKFWPGLYSVNPGDAVKKLV